MKFIKLISIFAFAMISGFAFAAAPGSVVAETVTGKVAITAANGAVKQLVQGAIFRDGSRISTTAESSAQIVLANGTVIFLSPNTVVDISQFEQNNPDAVVGQDFATFAREPEATSGSLTTLRLVKGRAVFSVAKLLPSSNLTVKTRAGNIVVKGTAFSVEDNGTTVTTKVLDGAVAVSPTGRGSFTVTEGKSVALPVAPSGVVGSPRFMPVSKSEIEKTLASVDTGKDEAPARGAQAGAPADGTFLDPEVPTYAEDGAVDGPNAGLLNSASSVTERKY